MRQSAFLTLALIACNPPSSSTPPDGPSTGPDGGVCGPGTRWRDGLCVPALDEDGVSTFTPVQGISVSGFVVCYTPKSWVHADGTVEKFPPAGITTSVTVEDPAIGRPAAPGVCGKNQAGVLAVAPGNTFASLRLSKDGRSVTARVGFLVKEANVSLVMEEVKVAVGSEAPFGAYPSHGVTGLSVDCLVFPHRDIRYELTNSALASVTWTKSNQSMIRGNAVGTTEVVARWSKPAGHEVTSNPAKVTVHERGELYAVGPVTLDPIAVDSVVSSGECATPRLLGKFLLAGTYYDAPMLEATWTVSGASDFAGGEVCTRGSGLASIRGCVSKGCGVKEIGVHPSGAASVTGLSVKVLDSQPMVRYTDKQGWNVICPPVQITAQLTGSMLDVTHATAVNWKDDDLKNLPYHIPVARALNADQTAYVDANGYPCIYDQIESVPEGAPPITKISFIVSYGGWASAFDLPLSSTIVVRPK